MKLDHLPIGARFQWKGALYTKVGPMTGVSESGGTVFIPKHAVLQPAPGESPPEPPPIATPLDAARVIAAFERYHRVAVERADEEGRALLARARERFLTEIR